MDHTFVDGKSLKSLEELVVFLGGTRLSIKTLIILQIRSIKAGIMPEDMNERACHILGALQEVLRLVEQQIDANLDLLPDDFKAEPVIEKLKKKELTRARSMLRKPKEPKCDT